jgi:hypothetical protein
MSVERELEVVTGELAPAIQAVVEVMESNDVEALGEAVAGLLDASSAVVEAVTDTAIEEGVIEESEAEAILDAIEGEDMAEEV